LLCRSRRCLNFNPRKSCLPLRRAEHLLRFRRLIPDTQATSMPFSMPSYFLGVGTVVGALTLGFGGGILLTKTAIKDTAGPSRIERAARSEPTQAAPQVTEARAVPVPRADPAVSPVTQVQAAAAPAPQVQTIPEPAKPVEPASAAEPVKQLEPVKQVDAKQAEPRESGQWASARELRRAEREQRRMERRAERERYYAERRARATEVVRVRQRPLEEREQPARPELAFEREAPRPNVFEGLFGRAQDAAPGERE
jgi:hypothetical protein